MAGRESQLEKFISDFVLEKTTQRVRLHLDDEITVRPVNLSRTGGAFLLATFWANVLQHQLNYPPAKFTYSRQQLTTDHCCDDRPRELLRLAIENDGVRLFVDMTTGVLTVAGKFVYDWFTTKFRQVLENVDAQFARDWVFVATPTGDLPLPISDDHTQGYEKTETEAYLTFEGRGRQRIDQRLQNHLIDCTTDDNETPQHSEVPWSSDEVQKQLTDVLGNGGGLFDGSLYIYPLWLSVLWHWFSRADGATVYIATPLLDSIRLTDIVNVCTKFADVQLGALYINFDHCDPDCRRGSDAGCLQHRVLQRYTSATARAAVEYLAFRHIVYPLRHRLAGSGSFLARSATSDNEANVDIILTGSSFHARDLRHNHLSTVSSVRMTFDAFRQRYLAPLEVKAVTATKLY